MSVVFEFEKIALQCSENISVIFNDIKLSYHELNKKSNQIANYILCNFKRPKEYPIPLIIETSEYTIITILAILKLGYSYVPIASNCPRDKMNDILNNIKSDIIITNTNYNNEDYNVINVNNIDFSQYDNKNLNIDINSRDLAYIIYTSGSTGKPKGVMIEHRSILNLCNSICDLYSLYGKQNCKSNLFSCYVWDVFVGEMFGNLLRGNTIYIFPDTLKTDVNELYKYINMNDIEICYIPPALLSVLPYDDKCCIKTIMFAGEKCDKKTGDFWSSKVNLYNCYGPAECTIYSTISHITKNKYVNTIGKPLKNIIVHVFDENNSEIFKSHTNGELYIGGECLARGYYNNISLTNEKFVHINNELLYKTGDIVYYDDNNEIVYVCRNDNQVNLNGKRVEMESISNIINENENINNSYVTCVNDDENINKYLICYYTINKNFYYKSIVNNIASNNINVNLFDFSEYNDDEYTVWKSSLTGKTIPTCEMEDWTKNTIKKINFPKKKNKILEIGCGNGLILFNILDKIEHYVGIDVSQNTVEYLKNKTKKINCNINIHCSEIFDFIKNNDNYDNYFDIILINSVVQYFPSEDYLLNCLKLSEKLLNTRGVIFIGDIRNNNFIDIFNGIKKYNFDDKELLISPDFFKNLYNVFEKKYYYKLNSKESFYCNEMTLFRYDVNIIFEYEGDKYITEIEYDKHDDDIYLNRNIIIKNIPDGRKMNDTQSFIKILNMLQYCTYDILINDNYYYFDIVIYNTSPIYNCVECDNNINIYNFFNIPNKTNLNKFYSNNIINFLRTKCDDFCIPKKFYMLDKFILNNSGKIDKLKLPRINNQYYKYNILSDNENFLLNIISEVTNVNKNTIDIDNHFQNLGIDSISVIKICLELKKYNKILSVKDFFTYGSIRKISEHIIDGCCEYIGDNEKTKLCEEKDDKIYEIYNNNDDIYVIHHSFGEFEQNCDNAIKNTTEFIKFLLNNNKTVMLAAFNYDSVKTGKHDITRKSQVGFYSDYILHNIIDAEKTNNPVFSWVVCGKLKKELLNCDETSAFDENSVFDFLSNCKYNVKYLFINNHHFTHFCHCEKKNNINYRYNKVFYLDNGKYKYNVRNTYIDPKYRDIEVFELNNISKINYYNGFIKYFYLKDIQTQLDLILKTDPLYLIENKEYVQNKIDEKYDAYTLMKKLYPICRSITGNGVRKTLEIIANIIKITLYEIPSGTDAYDWIIPMEWNINDAYIKNSKGDKIIDFQKNNLHILSYSIPINTSMNFNELKEHIYYIEKYPNWIPYLTTYYNNNWGFALSYNDYLSMDKNENYEVVIDTSFKKGYLTYADYIIPGKTKKEILLSTYICHPSMCNDILSGIVVLTYLADYLSKNNNYYTYRIVFVPETIGAITYIKNNFPELKNNVVGGYTLSCVGDEGEFTYMKTRDENHMIDKVTLHILKYYTNNNFKTRYFKDCGSDERQYNYPGVDLNIGSLMKTKYGEFSEYHTSADNFDLVTEKGLNDSLDMYKKCIECIEKNHYYINVNLCEPQLGKRNLYNVIGGQKDKNKVIYNRRVILYYCDGKHDLIDIANILDICVSELYEEIDVLLSSGLIKIKN